QDPPESGGELGSGVAVVGDDQRIIANAGSAEQSGDLIGRGDLRRNRIGEIHDVARPVDIDSTGNVAGGIFVVGAQVLGALVPIPARFRPHGTAHTHHAYRRV